MLSRREPGSTWFRAACVLFPCSRFRTWQLSMAGTWRWFSTWRPELDFEFRSEFGLEGGLWDDLTRSRCPLQAAGWNTLGRNMGKVRCLIADRGSFHPPLCATSCQEVPPLASCQRPGPHCHSTARPVIWHLHTLTVCHRTRRRSSLF